MRTKLTEARKVDYDRKLLLFGAKRNAVLDLHDVRQYGIDSYNNADYVSIYGMSPVEWFQKGIRLLGRTAVECTRDVLGNAVGEDIARIAGSAPDAAGALIIDPFAGSGNTLFWILRHLPGARGLGFELDAGVHQLTGRNLATLALPIDILNTDYVTGLAEVGLAKDQLLVAFIAPPWGEALGKTSGLDLRRTTPPIIEIVDLLIQRLGHNKLLCAIQIYEKVNPASMDALTPRFDWTAIKLYGLNEPGENHGILLGTLGWVPEGHAA
jgi:hypothetical protein